MKKEHGIAKVIFPSNLQKKHSAIECSICGLRYKKWEYEILKNAEKLLYFQYENNPSKHQVRFSINCLCHTCLKEVVLDDLIFEDRTESTVLILEGKKKSYCTFYYSD